MTELVVLSGCGLLVGYNNVFVAASNMDFQAPNERYMTRSAAVDWRRLILQVFQGWPFPPPPARPVQRKERRR